MPRATDNNGLDDWLRQQIDISAQNMLRSISATTLCRERSEFGQRIVPARGSVLASPVIANWNPEPDYFFHWTRDAAAVMRAVTDLWTMASTTTLRRQWQQCFHDMVDFNLSVSHVDTLKREPDDYRTRTRPDCRKFLRNRNQLHHLHGDKLLAEPRFNPDGSVDILRWSRPQLDGPALRALALLHWLDAGGSSSPQLVTLLERDLDFTLRHAGHRSIGPWEEPHEFGRHYHVQLVQLGALVHGRGHAGDRSARWRRAENRLQRALDRHWLPSLNVLAAIHTADTAAAPGAVADSAVLLAIVDAGLGGIAHSVCDPRATATLDCLSALFADAMPVNHSRPAGTAPALGRSLADRYFGGGAWYVTTLAAAAFCYLHALAQPEGADPWLARGDSWLATVRWLTPTDGSMSEQVDRLSGEPRSARHLTWSYAALISTARLRMQALATNR